MRYLADTSAVARFLRDGADAWGWGEALDSGLVGMCEITEMEVLRSARSSVHHKQMQQYLSGFYAFAPVPDAAFRRSLQVQQTLVDHGEHRSAGPVDLLVAAVAELSGLTLLHCDRDFEAIARHTGQPTLMLTDGSRP
ncbi:PIN domain nuclease [Streptomyces genisteinicus]|uniref:Ribonuclease VapC n=1 Tax=Streptomyces genisteinicus TaxID=2768068 RepID=A0A7H0HWR6_9ACTN|nr:PIN domain nuclease [Streptomyces genisteinicus]QNP64982.1 PIN domain nuclease [Streptomyces genisteinicus]